MVSLRQHMPAGFEDLQYHAQVSCIERAFKSIGGDPDLIVNDERHEISSLLYSISESFPDDPSGQQASRLYGEISLY